MKQTIRRGAWAVRAISKARPREFRWSIYGILVGALAGTFIGGMGIAVLGLAFGLPASLISAIVGGMIGNRVGVEKDHKARSEEAAD